MSTPVLEIALAPIKGRTIDDESTADGEIWREIFSHVTNIPGLIRACWGLRKDNRDINCFFVDWESYPHHERFMNEQGTLSKPIMDLMTADFNMYHIQTSNQSRDWLRAPITYISFYVNPKVEHFAAPLKALEDLYKQHPGCIEVTSGDAKNPPRHDSQGWMKEGKPVVIMLSGWDSEESLEKALKSSAVAAATEEIEKTPVKVDSFPVTFTVVEKTRWEHKWRRIAPPYLKDIAIDGETAEGRGSKGE